MKPYILALLLSIIAANAGATVITDFVPVDVGDASGVPIGFTVYEMVVTTDSDWTNERLDLSLTSGTLYQDPLGGYTAPNPALFEYAPSLEWDTFASAPGNPSRLASLVGLLVIDDTHFQASWFDCATSEAPGTFTLGQITLSNDAQGTLTGKTFDIDTAGVGVSFAFEIADGRFIRQDLPVTIPEIDPPMTVDPPLVADPVPVVEPPTIVDPPTVVDPPVVKETPTIPDAPTVVDPPMTVDPPVVADPIPVVDSPAADDPPVVKETPTIPDAPTVVDPPAAVDSTVPDAAPDTTEPSTDPIVAPEPLPEPDPDPEPGEPVRINPRDIRFGYTPPRDLVGLITVVIGRIDDDVHQISVDLVDEAGRSLLDDDERKELRSVVYYNASTGSVADGWSLAYLYDNSPVLLGQVSGESYAAIPPMPLIPEPACLSLLMLGAVLGLFRRRR